MEQPPDQKAARGNSASRADVSLSSSENVRAPHGQERVCVSSLLGGGGALCEVLSSVRPGLLGPRSKPVLRCSLYLS